MAGFVAAGSPLRHDRLLRVFDGAGDTADVEVFPLGRLAVPSGRVVVCDPSEAVAAGAAEPFDQEFARGAFDVRGLIVRDGRDQRIGALEVRFQAGSPQGLQPAFTPTWREQVIRKPAIPWTSIDSATIGLGSAEAFEALAQRDAHDDSFFGEIAPGPSDGSNPYLSGRSSDLFTETELGGTNLFVVLAGRGDGEARSCVERAADGRVLRLFVDFGLLGWALPIIPDQ